MKYILIATVVLFASCNKAYICECRTPTGGYLSTTSQETGKTQQEAADKCEARQAKYGAGINCQLQ